MEKSAVIAIRDALLANDKNNPIRIVFDNGDNLSLAGDIVIWDDNKEMILGFVADSTSGSFIANMPIRIICSTYENIQFINGYSNTKNLKNIIEGLSSTVSIQEDAKSKIIEYFSKIYSDKYDLSHKAYNPIDIIRDKSEKLKDNEKE